MVSPWTLDNTHLNGLLEALQDPAPKKPFSKNTNPKPSHLIKDKTLGFWPSESN